MNTNQIPFDPDFDEIDRELAEANLDTIESIDDNRRGLSPKQAFVAGLISSVLAMGTIGFVILVVKISYS